MGGTLREAFTLGSKSLGVKDGSNKRGTFTVQSLCLYTVKGLQLCCKSIGIAVHLQERVNVSDLR